MKRLRIIAVVLALTVICCTAAGCGGRTGKQFTSYSYFDTQTAVVVFDELKTSEDTERAEMVWEEIKEAFAEVERAIDFRESSLAAFNAALPGETVEIDEVCYAIMTLAKEYYAATDGAFNPAVGALTDLWGFAPREEGVTPPYDRGEGLPRADYIEAFRTLTCFDEVLLIEDNGTYYAKKPSATATVDGRVYDVKVDLGGIGKGYAADTAAKILTEAGYRYGYVAVGGSSIVLLENCSSDYGDGDNWYVDVVHPRQIGATYARFEEKSAAVSTSGDYERYFIRDGTRYSHIIDAATGYPAAGKVASATVVCGSAAEGDAISTALCVMGADKAAAFAAGNADKYRITFLIDDGGRLGCYNGSGAKITADGIEAI